MANSVTKGQEKSANKSIEVTQLTVYKAKIHRNKSGMR